MAETFYVYEFREQHRGEIQIDDFYALKQKLTPKNVKDFAKAADSASDYKNTELVGEFSRISLSVSEVKFMGEATADEVKTLRKFEIISEVIDLEGKLKA
ncbi:MAG: hypothetical protein V1839_03345 [archaeon]